MKTGKDAGSDCIETEHLLNAHSILVSLLNVLFSATLKYGYVPQVFCWGIVIPLIKDKQGNAADITNYRHHHHVRLLRVVIRNRTYKTLKSVGIVKASSNN